MAVALCSETFRAFQMNKWLGEFYQEQFFDIAVIGDRTSVGGSFLRNLLGEDNEIVTAAVKISLPEDAGFEGEETEEDTLVTHQSWETTSLGEDNEIVTAAVKISLPEDAGFEGEETKEDTLVTDQSWETTSSSLGEEIYAHKFTEEVLVESDIVAGVNVTATLVPALSDATGYKDEGYFSRVLDVVVSADLVLYCVDMLDTRLRGSVLRTLQKLDPDWSKTVIVLTFADALPVLVRNRDNPHFSKGQYFNAKLAEWISEVKATLKRIGVQREVVAKVNICPSANEPGDLPNGEPWLAPLSLAIMEILSPKKKATFLATHAMHMLLPIVTTGAIQQAVLTPSHSIAANAELPMILLREEMAEVQPSSKKGLQVSSPLVVLSEDQSRSIRAAFSHLRKDCPVFGVLVIGRTGVGKSTLINNLLGKEVARVGHALQSETRIVYPHEDLVEGVPIVVYDTPGLGDVKGEEDEKLHLEIMKDFIARKKIHLVVYCFQMNQAIVTSSLVGALHKYHQIGVDWERSVIALTFADALYVPKSEQEYHKRSYLFDRKLDFWETELRRQLVETFGVKSNVVERLKLYPTSLLPTDQLPNGNPWYVPLWLHIVEILSPPATVRFLDIHRNNICDEQAPPLSNRAEVQVKLRKEEMSRFFDNIDAIIERAAAESGMEKIMVIRALAVMDSNEVNRAVPSIRDFLKLLTPEQVRRSGSEPHQDDQAVLRFKSFGDCFVENVQSKDNPAFTAKLYRQKVIPESLKNQIAAANDGETANELLFDILCKQATCESLSKLVAAMIEADAIPP